MTLGISLIAIVGPPGAAGVVSSCGTWRPVWSPNPAGADSDHELTDVAVLSPTNQVAVGIQTPPNFRPRLLAERWDGRAWHVMHPITPVGESALIRVARIDRTAAWAVGNRRRNDESFTRTLIERLSGDAWTVVPSPDRRGDTVLSGVDSIAADDAWAVGGSSGVMNFNSRTLAMHWDGTSWTIVPTPNPPAGGHLSAVDMLSATDGWAVGGLGFEGEPNMLIQRWDGTAWSTVPSPNVGGIGSHLLSGVAARSPTDAFAVGWFIDRSGGTRPLVLHWDGMAWKRVAPATLSAHVHGELRDVAMTVAGSAYAVGSRRSGHVTRSIIVRSDGTSWTRMPLSTAAESHGLQGVAAGSATNVVGVGHRSRAGEDRVMTFAVQCMA